MEGGDGIGDGGGKSRCHSRGNLAAASRFDAEECIADAPESPNNPIKSNAPLANATSGPATAMMHTALEVHDALASMHGFSASSSPSDEESDASSTGMGLAPLRLVRRALPLLRVERSRGLSSSSSAVRRAMSSTNGHSIHRARHDATRRQRWMSVEPRVVRVDVARVELLRSTRARRRRRHARGARTGRGTECLPQACCTPWFLHIHRQPGQPTFAEIAHARTHNTDPNTHKYAARWRDAASANNFPPHTEWLELQPRAAPQCSTAGSTAASASTTLSRAPFLIFAKPRRFWPTSNFT